MNGRSMMNSPNNNGQGVWLDKYMPDGQLARIEPQPEVQFLTFGFIRGILFRQRWLIAGLIGAAVVAGLVITLLTTPVYEARSSVRIDPYGAFIVEGQNLDQAVGSSQMRDQLSTYIGIITSHRLASQVAEDLNLGERDDFLGADIDEDRPPNLTDEAWREAKQARAAAILQNNVSAEVPDLNWIIEIAYRSDSPAIAAEVANAYLAAFATSESREALENNRYAQDYLRDQIEQVRQRLQVAEVAANNYARNNGIIIQAAGAEEGESQATLTTSRLANINSRVSEARAARIAAEQRWRTVQDVPSSELPEVLESSLLQRLIADRTAQQARLAELRQRYLEGHPQVRDLIAQIAELDAQIERSAGDIRAAARTDYLVALSQEQALSRELNAVTGDTLQEQDSRVQYGVLEREVQALSDQLQVLLNRFNEVSTAANVETGRLIPLDYANVPSSPVAPSLPRNLMLGLALGAALAAGLALLRETLDDKVRSPEGAEEKIGLPLLGHTPFVAEYDGASEEELDRFSPLMEAYASIRSTLDFSLAKDRNVIQFTSSQAAEGKSTTALILAEMFARLGRRTLLIDADLRRPALAKMTNSPRSKAGLVQVLQEQVDVEAAVVKGTHENLEILLAGEAPSNPTEIFASERLRQFIERARQEYSLVIFDSSPMLGLADAPMLSGLVDGTIFVLEANKVHFGQVRAGIKRLRGSGGHPVGAILTKYRALEDGQSYYYNYAYYQYGNEGKTA
ncbi:polysaccharide biosynthesis tyrosine autokinase [Aurantiacibacter sp. MUD11]|uniref:GumC family protein n=1 Tax=Aurantiacibacter sp. MUD11 TaxID=3003265 RepID=UPI0022AA8BE6|nr:polysaccharide biosynthesis tyrosine autokinase [Aurantiacibacter sp. MUD11]WAT17039.1 polysaccharide biosynthesis tyrosine autokinase [Aurantiacibacter sp. MUD11]